MKHWKKLIAPIVISVIIALYLLGFVLLSCLAGLAHGAFLLGIIIPLALLGVTIAMLVERIKEIRSGEEDDLSQY